jgi:hypothetical protein
MTEQEFLDHYRLTRNPFADEDAQTDAVFKECCIEQTYHPAWSKVYGDPCEPATAIVLGSKGAGKTAMRLQIVKQLQSYNRTNPEKRVFFIQYDDFNAFLGPLQQSLPGRYRSNPDRVLQSIRKWDHMDAILCQSVTSLVDRILKVNDKRPSDHGMEIDPAKIVKLDRGQKRDVLLLAAAYDQAHQGSFQSRWSELRKTLRYGNLPTWSFCVLAIVGTLLSGLLGYALIATKVTGGRAGILLALGIVLLSWLPYLGRYVRHAWMAMKLKKNIRVGRRDIASLTNVLMDIPSRDLAAQPLPMSPRSDDRYAMLEKLQSLLRSLGFPGLIVIVDRVDEPDLVNGLPERMQALVWPLLDNKLLKHPGLGFKLLLPSNLLYFLDRESREFNERARLDKQNLIRNFDWTGEALYDLLAARLRACSTSPETPVLPSDLVADSISEQRLLSSMQSLRTPRSLFRFWYRLLAEHCKQHRSKSPSFTISSELFESTLAVYQSEANMATALS